MRNFSPELKNHLQKSATTMCSCWIIRRRDGGVLGFTDHDRDLMVGDVPCKASSGLQATEAASELGLAVDSQEVEGALFHDAITDHDIQAERYDDARVEVWMVNWAEPEQRHHIRTALIGEVSQQDSYFKAELRGLTALLDRVQSRSYARHCDAILGDGRCGVNTTHASYKISSEVTVVKDRLNFSGSGLGSFAPDWFAYGSVQWTSGANAGLSMELAGRQPTEPETVRLWQAMPDLPMAGDTFTITAGCDKSFTTCRDKFSNGLNFRGCPHMPGTDFALSYASGDEVHDGSPLVR